MARRLATEHLGVQQQTDTYFHVTRGRLKLREITGEPAYLVWYDRPDVAEQKGSDYLLTPVSEPGLLKQSLSLALGELKVVRKAREIFLVHNVRIHLDTLEGSGTFLEFEAVLSPDVSDAQGHRQLEQLCEQFAIGPEDLLSGSYCDMPDS